MTFYEQMISTFTGASLGFIFAIVLFYVSEHVKKKKIELEILKLFKREINFNLNLLQKFKKDIITIIEKITANDSSINTYLKYSDFQVIFFGKIFQSGYIYKVFSEDEDIVKTINCLNHFTIFSENYINGKVGEYKNGEINQANMLGLFQFERDNIDTHLQTLKNVEIG